MKSSPTIYVVGQLDTDAFTDYSPSPFSGFDQLNDQDSALFYIHLGATQQDEFLEFLHQQPNGWRNLIYTSSESTFSQALSDGKLPQNWLDKWQAHGALLEKITTTPTDTLLAWLWLNKKRRLSPVCDGSKPSLYYYPLIRSYFQEENEPYGYLNIESKQGYLEQLDSVDRIRQCPSCHSGHQNYIETCPACNSTDIKESISLHCFTCGHVDDQGTFTRQGRLECPNCLTQLRHIGVDYDRPLESFRCQSCDHYFAESVTRARCLSCKALNETSKLIKREIYTYKAGERVRSLMLYGKRATMPTLSLNGLVDANYYHSLVSWLNMVALRHKHSHLMIVLTFKGLETFYEEQGEFKMLQLTEQLTERLNGILRTTDICCQYSSDLLFLLMPHTPSSAVEIVQNKIAKLAEYIEYDITLNVHFWPIPDETMDKNTELWITQKLAQLNE